MPKRWKHACRVEDAAQEGKRGEEECRHHAELFKVFCPDAEDESEQGKRECGEESENESENDVRDRDAGNDPRDDEYGDADSESAGSGGKCESHHDLKIGEGRSEKIAHGTDKPREVNAARCRHERVHEKCHHDESGYDEVIVGYAVNRFDIAANRASEDKEIEQGGDNRREKSLNDDVF